MALLGIDLGTSSVKVLALDHQGQTLALSKADYPANPPSSTSERLSKCTRKPNLTPDLIGCILVCWVEAISFVSLTSPTVIPCCRQ